MKTDLMNKDTIITKLEEMLDMILKLLETLIEIISYKSLCDACPYVLEVDVYCKTKCEYSSGINLIEKITKQDIISVIDEYDKKMREVIK